MSRNPSLGCDKKKLQRIAAEARLFEPWGFVGGAHGLECVLLLPQ